MKKLFAVLFVLGFVLATPFTVSAVKPDYNNAGAMEVGWNLSGAVMPVPPYGSLDIPDSDTASKLIVNQPNGNTEATVTGVMNGLEPNTIYTVYPSKGWVEETSWPGLFGSLQTFTFTTDEFGSGSWHFNLKNADFSGSGTYQLSIWINMSGHTILISDNFEEVVE